MKTKQEVVVDYLDNFPLIKNAGKNNWVSIEWLDKDINFSVSDNPMAGGGVLREMFGGMKIIQYSFMFQAEFPRTSDVKQMLENSGFFEQLSKWIATNNNVRVLPQFEDDRKALKIEVQQTPYMYSVSEDGRRATYSMGIVMEYLGTY